MKQWSAMKNNKNYKGMTLIEILIYLAIFAAIFTVIIQYALATMSSNQKSEYKYELASSSAYLHEHFNTSFFSSTSTDEFSSVFYNDNGKLTLNGSSGNYTYYIDSGMLYFNRAGTVNAVTPSSLYITKFYVSPIRNNDNVIIAIEITTGIQSSKDSNVTKELNSIYKY